MKLKRILAAIVAGAILFTGCGNAAQTTAETTENIATDTEETDTITVIDNNGDTVIVPKEINRIAICSIYPLASVLTVFFNSADKIVGMPPASMTAAKNGLLGQIYPEILNAETGYTDGDTVNVEELLKLNPDVVFYSASATEVGEQLKNAGFAAIAVSVNKWEYNCIETLNNWIDLLSQMFPENDRSAAVEQYSNDTVAMINERVSTLSEEDKANIFFLFQYTDTNIVTSGKNFFGQWWADASGANNVAEELEKDNSAAVNMEQVIAWNPDIVFVTNFTTAQPDDLYNNTIGTNDWSSINAVKNQRVYKMPLGLYRSYTPGADVPVTLLWMAKAVYPDLFSDIDVTAEAVEYYKTVFGLELTNEQVEQIFAPVSAAGQVTDTTR